MINRHLSARRGRATFLLRATLATVLEGIPVALVLTVCGGQRPLSRATRVIPDGPLIAVLRVVGL